MSERAKKAIEKMTKIIPKLDEAKVEYFIGYADARADMRDELEKSCKAE